MKCGRGKIRRKAYTTKRGVHVPSSCVADQGKPGKGRKVLPKPEPGFLHGWAKKMSSSARHKKVASVVKKEGCATAIRRLNLLANYTKATSPETHRKARADMKWVKGQGFCHLKSKRGR